MNTPASLQPLLPYAVIAVVLVLRWRSIGRPRPLRPALLLAVPVIVTVVAALALLTLPPVAWELPVLLAGLAIGAVAGWQRARLMHLERDAETGQILLRNSPLAFLLVLGVLAARRLVLWEAGIDMQARGQGAAAMMAIYATLGFALGLVWASRIELWRRARALE